MEDVHAGFAINNFFILLELYSIILVNDKNDDNSNQNTSNKMEGLVHPAGKNKNR